MMRGAIAVTAGVACLVVACSEPGPVGILPVFDDDASMSVVSNDGENAAATLSGAEEVPARPTLARGEATFHRSADGNSLTYRLIVANIQNVVASHIHIGAAGTNGPVAVFLFGPAVPGGGRLDGVIAEGVITAANLIGPLAGATLDDLIAAMQAGNAYVNVHTNDGIGLPNTGPGDFPGGEVRGQIH